MIDVIRYLLFRTFLTKEKLELILILFIMFPGIACSESWFGHVKTTEDAWSVYRQSSNISYKSDQQIVGSIKAFEGPRGRILSPYCSYFENMNLNDIRLNERTGALEGNYSANEQVYARAKVNPPIGLHIDKPVDSDIYTIDFIEKWPVDISAIRSLKYSGMGINNRDFSGNDLDFMETNLLYNKKLSKDLSVEMRLEKMNATVIATDDKVISAERKATRDLEFRISTSTTGIADFKYQQSGSEFNPVPMNDHGILNRGDERFQGSFDITRNIRMKSRFDNSKQEDTWLPCCYQGLMDMNIFDKRSVGMDRIFNCTCSGIQGGKP